MWRKVPVGLITHPRYRGQALVIQRPLAVQVYQLYFRFLFIIIIYLLNNACNIIVLFFSDDIYLVVVHVFVISQVLSL